MSNIINQLELYEISYHIIKDKVNKNNEHLHVPNKNHSVPNKNHNVSKKIHSVPNKNQYYWFYYICKYGIEYNKTLELVSKDKFKQIDSVRQNTAGLKLLKIKKQTFEEDIIYSKHIHISVLKVLAYYNKLSLLVLKKGCYYFFNYGDIVYVLDNHKIYKITTVKLEEIENNNYCIPMVNKIMYASSHYKLADLHNIAKQLNLSYYKIVKKELYDSIKFKLMQII